MSAHRGISYPFLKRPSRICAAALASRFPCTVILTRSKPLSAHRITCSMVPFTSDVSVVAIVCRTIGCSEPNFTGPHSTVRVLRRITLDRSSQYWPRSPYFSSRPPDFHDGVHRMSSAVFGYSTTDWNAICACAINIVSKNVGSGDMKRHGKICEEADDVIFTLHEKRNVTRVYTRLSCNSAAPLRWLTSTGKLMNKDQPWHR
mmetsp:Transcript_18284/g.41742  ORF Transcript_18284/g.41742 Transcript_18284/m.41742 type:complete len:203 (+) Transcript_18284:1951-2559(+)